MKKKDVKVDLSSKKLEAVDEAQLTKANLTAETTALKIQSNSLKDLPWALIASKAPTLRVLNLTKNAFALLNGQIALLTALEELILSNNHLSDLPLDIGQLTKLKRLQLDHNQLECLPPTLGALTDLTTLNLTSNRLLSLPPECHTLTQLKTLELANNPLLTPPPDLLKFPLRVCAYLKGIFDAQNSKHPRFPVHLEQIEASPKIYHLPPAFKSHSLGGPQSDNFWYLRHKLYFIVSSNSLQAQGNRPYQEDRFTSQNEIFFDIVEPSSSKLRRKSKTAKHKIISDTAAGGAATTSPSSAVSLSDSESAPIKMPTPSPTTSPLSSDPPKSPKRGDEHSERPLSLREALLLDYIVAEGEGDNGEGKNSPPASGAEKKLKRGSKRKAEPAKRDPSPVRVTIHSDERSLSPARERLDADEARKKASPSRRKHEEVTVIDLSTLKEKDKEKELETKEKSVSSEKESASSATNSPRSNSGSPSNNSSRAQSALKAADDSSLNSPRSIKQLRGLRRAESQGPTSKSSISAISSMRSKTSEAMSSRPGGRSASVSRPVRVQDRVSFFGVYDGHGGDRAAEYLKNNLHGNVVAHRESLRRGEMAEPLKLGFEKTEADFIDASRKEMFYDGSTAVVVMLCGHKLAVAHVGDSRAILCRGKKAVPLTVDHKPDRADESERIEKAGGAVVNNNATGWIARVNGHLAVSRAFGDIRLKEPFIGVTAEPEITEMELNPQDQFIVLASDGLWDVLENQEVVDLIRKGTVNKAEAVDALIQKALKLGTSDNVTATIVWLSWNLEYSGSSAPGTPPTGNSAPPSPKASNSSPPTPTPSD